MSDQRGDARAMTEQIAKWLVDEPGAVSVTQIDGETTVLELRVAENDIGKVIGRSGRVARALRGLINAAGLRAQKRYELEIVE
jgi:predicted RNA-binding protein YlqC (UPF0109 family)